MNKNKKILFTILIIMVIVALGLVAYQYSGNKLETKVQKGVEAEGNKTEESVEEGKTEESKVIAEKQQEEIDDIMSEAIRTQNMSVCEKIKNEDIKKLCITNAIIAKAGVERDTTICDQIEEEEIKVICKDNVINNKAY